MNEAKDFENLPSALKPSFHAVRAAPPPNEPSHRLTLHLCGGVTVTGEGGSLGPSQLGGAKSRQILIALSERRGHPVSKAHLVHLLWGDEPHLGAVATLETYISLLRKRLDGLSAHGATAIRTTPAGYALDPQGILIDVDLFDRGCRSAREVGLPPDIALDRWSAALGTLEGEYLAGEAGTSWIDAARRQHDLRLARVLADAAETALRAGACETAEQYAARGLALDSLHERCWRFLLESYEARGLHAEGVRAYDACRRSFVEELGCAPGPHVQAAFERLLLGTGETAQDGLTAAVEAVVRLYISLAPNGHRHRRGAELNTQSSFVADDYQVLHDLLARARGAGGAMALSA